MVNLTPEAALVELQTLLSGKEWSADTIEAVAEIVAGILDAGLNFNTY